MNKKSLLALTLVMTLLLSACGGKDLVEVELPSMVLKQSFGEFSEENAKELINEDEGIMDAKVTDDGSLVLTITKDSHKKFVKEMDEQIKSMIDQLKESEEIAFIKDIKYTDDYKKVTIVADKKSYEQAPEMGIIISSTLAGGIGAYQSYAKVDVGSEVIIEDESANELFKLNYPEDMDKLMGK